MWLCSTCTGKACDNLRYNFIETLLFGFKHLFWNIDQRFCDNVTNKESESFLIMVGIIFKEQ